MASGNDQSDASSRRLNVNMQWVWAGVFVIVARLSPRVAVSWQDLSELSTSGVSDDQTQLLAFIGGYTAPATAGVAVITYLCATGVFSRWGLPASIFVASGILMLAGWLSRQFSLGLAPDFGLAVEVPYSPSIVRIPVAVLSTYLNTYGWALFLSAVAIGVATGLHVAVHVHGSAPAPNQPAE